MDCCRAESSVLSQEQDQELFIPLPGYELTDELQNGIPAARPIQPDFGPLPGFPLPEASPALPRTTGLDPGDLPLDPVETFPLGQSRIAEIWAIRQQDPSLRIQAGDPLLNGIISPQRQKHILYGDVTGGGHLSGVGVPDKSEFPPSWTEPEILEVAADLATNSGVRWQQTTEPEGGTIHPGYPGPKLTNNGDSVRYHIVGQAGILPIVNGVTIEVIIQPDGAGVIAISHHL